VFAIVFAVAVVVDDVDAAGDAGEGDETVEYLQQNVDISEDPAEEYGDKKKQILCPVFGSQ
jgi:hypothetical protein